MQFKLTQEEMVYFTNFFNALGHGDGVSRHLRRNLQRLANKFRPPQIAVKLKPADKFQVINFAKSGIQSLKASIDKEQDKTKLDHMNKVHTIISGVLSKLEDAEFKSFEKKEDSSAAN